MRETEFFDVEVIALADVCNNRYGMLIMWRSLCITLTPKRYT
ncbi:hypothetical protein [Allocoleopsis franciscana]|nr:hypothetical protein [Allocoleopsis franciscana]